MEEVIVGLMRGARGLVEIARYAPGQVVRTFQMLSPSDRITLVRAVIPLGDGYFYDGPVSINTIEER